MEGVVDVRPGRPRSESAKRAILRASLDLLRKNGLAGVTAEAVARRAKVSKATLYRWWPCAAATAMDAFFEEVFSQLSVAGTDDPLHDIRVRLRQGVRLMASDLGDVLAGLIATTHTDPRIAQSFQERYVEPARKDFRRLLQRAVDQGALRSDLDLDLAIDVISGAFFYRKLVCHRATSARTMDALLTSVFEGLTPRPHAAAKPARSRRIPPSGAAARSASGSPAARTRGQSGAARTRR